MKILILCTGNSARSQMAEGLFKSYDSGLQVFSAGTNPTEKINPFAIRAMQEIGIDISSHRPKSIDQFINQPFDFVVTVCDNARETCPVFAGQVKHRLHMGFEDPAEAQGTDDDVLSEFRRIRDQISHALLHQYTQTLTQN